MQFRHRVPRPPLDALIQSIWVYENDPRLHALERVLPSGAAQLIVNLKEDQTRLYDPECPTSRRFQRALGQVHHGCSVDWARVALDCDYFDQAHFIHDFRSFAGLTPTGYVAARTSFQNHVKFLQSDADGI